MRAYPYEYRVQFEREMMAVIEAAAGDRSFLSEIGGLVRGLLREWFRDFERKGRLVPALSVVSGAALLPIAHAQSSSEPAPLEIVTALYRNMFAAVHDAKTKEDIAKMVNTPDTPDWVSIDPHG